MGITLVGANFSSGTSSGTFTTSLTALTSGIDTAARAGDLVLAITAASNNATSGAGVSGVAGVEYTTLFTGYANDNLDCSCSVRYKYLTAEDATCLHFSNGLLTRGMVGIATVWRGVDPATPISNSGAAASTNTGRGNPPSGTTWDNQRPGGMTVIIGAGTAFSGTAFGGHLVFPAGFTGIARARHSGTVVSGGVNAAIGYRPWSGYGIEDPAAFTSGSVSTADSALGIIVSLNPSVNGCIMVAGEI